MIIHEIHDISNVKIIDFLKKSLSNIQDLNIIKNYHPEFSNEPGNLFYILEQGRYKHGRGKYFILEQSGEFISSCGWNEYDLDPDVALVLTRMYVNPRYRSKFYIGNHVLPIIIKETHHYKKVWTTFNEYNKSLYDWISRGTGEWPEIYKNFKPIGKKNIYYTEQYVAEFEKEK